MKMYLKVISLNFLLLESLYMYSRAARFVEKIKIIIIVIFLIVIVSIVIAF